MLVTKTTDILRNKISFETRWRELQRLDEQRQIKQGAYDRYARLYLDKYAFKKFFELGNHKNEIEIFFLMIKKANTSNLVKLNNVDISVLLNKKIRIINKGLKYLLDNDFIQKTNDETYVLNPCIVWKSFDVKKKKCKFDLSILGDEEPKAVKFVQIYTNDEYFDHTFKLLSEHTLFLTYLLLLKKSSKSNQVIVDKNYLIKKTKKSKSSVNKALKYLKDNELIYLLSEEENRYLLNPMYVWKGSPDNRETEKEEDFDV